MKRAKLLKRILMGAGILILLAEMLYTRFVQPLPTVADSLLCIIGMISLAAGTVLKWKDVNK